MRLRDLAASLGITERSAHGIVTDLAAAGYIVKQKRARQVLPRLSDSLAYGVGHGYPSSSDDLGPRRLGACGGPPSSWGCQRGHNEGTCGREALGCVGMRWELFAQVRMYERALAEVSEQRVSLLPNLIAVSRVRGW